MLASSTSKWGLSREEQAALLRGRTRPECPEGNLRELTWDSNPNCGIAGGGGRWRWRTEREREGTAGPAHRAKDWANTRGELASWGPAHPLPEAGRQAGSQPELERGKLGPRDGIPYQTASRLPVANQDFLWFWTVDICQEGCSKRSAPQKRHTAHLRWCTCWHPGNPAAGTGEVIRHTPPAGESVLAKHLVTWAAQTWEGHKTQAQPNLYICVLPENLNLSGLDLGSACNRGPT